MVLLHLVEHHCGRGHRLLQDQAPLMVLKKQDQAPLMVLKKQIK
jgi:hypothetical protein